MNPATGVFHATPDFIRNQKKLWSVPAESSKDVINDDHALKSSTVSPPEALSEARPKNTQSDSTKVESEPLLSAFEAELAKILEDSEDREKTADHYTAASQESQDVDGEVLIAIFWSVQRKALNKLISILTFKSSMIAGLTLHESTSSSKLSVCRHNAYLPY